LKARYDSSERIIRSSVLKTTVQMSDSAVPRGVRAPSVLILAGLTGLSALSIDMSLPAMPQLQRTFGASVGAVQLTLSLFLAGFALGQLVCGVVADRIGRRPVLLAGLALFSIAGLACAFSPSLPVLLAGRLVQGVGASVGPILARAIVRDCFSGPAASGVLSQITQVMIAAPLIAPTVGGFMLVSLGWPAIFVTLGGAGVLLWMICWRRLPETLPAAVRDAERIPLLRSFRHVATHPESLRHGLTICFSYAGMFAYISGSPFVLIDAFGVPRALFGVLFALPALALMAGATLNRRWVMHVAPDRLLRRGVRLVFGAGVVLVAAAWMGIGGVAGVMLPMMAYMLGMGLVQPNATAAALAPHGRMAGVTSSLIGSVQTAAGAVSGAVVGSFYDHTPRSMATTVAVAGVLTLLVHRTARPRRAAAEEEAVSPPLAAEA
jgi:DHA1 family bicyclomycin/chloramphenicol resistance-like MFS transporter